MLFLVVFSFKQEVPQVYNIITIADQEKSSILSWVLKISLN